MCPRNRSQISLCEYYIIWGQCVAGNDLKLEQVPGGANVFQGSFPNYIIQG